MEVGDGDVEVGDGDVGVGDGDDVGEVGDVATEIDQGEYDVEGCCLWEQTVKFLQESWQCHCRFLGVVRFFLLAFFSGGRTE